MQPRRTVNIKQKLAELDVSIESISLGEFDEVAELTAKRRRDPGSPLYKSVGAFFKPNCERGLLLYLLVKKYSLDSCLEIGFGRGYSALCAARAFHELGGAGKVMSIEPRVDDSFMQSIAQVMPQEWTSRLQLARGTSQEILPQLRDSSDVVVVDGDHTESAVRADWRGVKDLGWTFCVFDDWHVDVGTDPNIQVHEALLDQELPPDVECELIVMDRRIFPDERGWPDEKIRYGQLLLTNRAALDKRQKAVTFKETWDW